MTALKPFEQPAWLGTTAIDGSVQWQSGELRVTFRLQAPAGSVVMPEPNGLCERRDGLWQSTCFEAFIASPATDHYWEINQAPNGDWNVYRLDGYRSGLAPETKVDAPAYVIRRQPEQLNLSFSLKLQELLCPESSVEVSLTTVLEHPQHGCSYWAWSHAGEVADFHDRSSFQTLAPSS